MKIKAKLTIGFVSIALFSVAIVILPITLFETKSITKSVTTTANLQIDNVYKEIEIFLQKPYDMIETIENYLRQGDETSKPAIEEFFIKVKTDDPMYSMLYYINEVPMTQEGGTIYADNHWTPPEGWDQYTRSWFTVCMDNTNYNITEPYIDANTGDLVITIARSLFIDNTFKGVIALDVIATKLSEKISSIKLTDSADSFLILNTGIYATNTDGDKILAANFYDDFGFTEMKDNLSETTTYLDLENKEMYLAARNMPSETGWTFVTIGSRDELFVEMSNLTVTTEVMLAVCVVAGLLIGFLLSNRIAKPLILIRDSINDIAAGNADLSKRLEVPTQDEIGDVAAGFNRFVEKLQTIIRDIKDSNSVLVSAGSDLDDSTQNTSSSITEIIANINSIHGQITSQHNSVNETAGALNQIAASIQSLEHMVDNQSSGVSQASTAVEEMIGNINSVSNTMEKMADSFSQLEDSSNKGSEKQRMVNERIIEIENQSKMLQEANTTITNIAAQTNLLAMNAAIEAAHAGESGKGFSVVADEIRKLSETSTAQSKTIGDQLLNIKNSINEVVNISEESRKAFIELSSTIKDTDSLVQQVRSAMEEQTVGSQHILDALHSMNTSTSEVKTASKEMNEGNKRILEEMKVLQDATDNIKGSMDEMSVGAQLINETGVTLQKISGRVDESIQKINSEVDQFKV